MILTTILVFFGLLKYNCNHFFGDLAEPLAHIQMSVI